MESETGGTALEEHQRLQMLQYPRHPVDVVLDTDTFNEVDDQFALAYLLCNQEKLRLQAIYAAPFFNEKVDSPKAGMEKSYEEILNILTLAGVPEYKKQVSRGADHFLRNRKTPVESEATRDLIRRARLHSKDHPLYVIGIAAATNLASAILLDPSIQERIVVIWLGGSGFHCSEMKEFNLMEDIPATQALFNSGVPLVMVPCWGVVEHFSISKPELEAYLKGQNPLADYLASYAIASVEEWAETPMWTKAIWDVAAVAWLLNDNQRFMKEQMIPCPKVTDQGAYDFIGERHLIQYVYRIERDPLMTDLIRKITKI